MNFEESLKQGYAKRVKANKFRAKSLVKSAKLILTRLKKIPLDETTANTILRELYEALRQYCEAIGYLNGYKFLSHEAITHFISDVLKESAVALKFDRYRKLRNSINYYGQFVKIATVKNALIEIPKMIRKLERFLEF